jgi:hypothetical protein
MGSKPSKPSGDPHVAGSMISVRRGSISRTAAAARAANVCQSSAASVTVRSSGSFSRSKPQMTSCSWR